VIVPDASKIYRDKGSPVNRTPAVGAHHAVPNQRQQTTLP